MSGDIIFVGEALHDMPFQQPLLERREFARRFPRVLEIHGPRYLVFQDIYKARQLGCCRRIIFCFIIRSTSDDEYLPLATSYLSKVMASN
jgi:hypothetical protein